MEFMKDCEIVSKEEVKEFQEYVKHNGVLKIEEFFKKKLEKWRDTEVNIGVTGDTGTGKSSFINAIRGLKDDDHEAAAVDVTETTLKPTPYPHPTNPKIKFWDLPGIGTSNFPDKEKYDDEVKLDDFFAFLIFTGNRFRYYESQLTKEIAKEKEKKFFFIRAKIDVDVKAEMRKESFNEDAVLKKIRSYCSSNLAGLLRNEEDIFLISNHHPAKWDFPRLTQAILDKLPIYQRESPTLTLTNLSTNILQRKVELLKGRIWMIASASGAAGVVPVPGLSFFVDSALIMKEISFYRSQLGLPKEGSAKFAKLSETTQKEIKVFMSAMASVTQIGGLVAAYVSEQAAEEFTRMIPIVGFLAAGALSFASTYFFLKHCLEKMEKLAEKVLQETFANLKID